MAETDQNIARLKDLLGKDLAGYQIVECHYLALTHSLMGFFPAVIDNDTGEKLEMIICPDVHILNNVERLLPDRPHHRKSLLCLYHPETGKGFSFEANDPKTEAEEILFLTRSRYDQLRRESDTPFCWAPGLI